MLDNDNAPANFASPQVKAAYDAMADDSRKGALALRRLIFQVAGDIRGLNGLEECLKWGQPSYLTRPKGMGTTIRIGQPKSGGFAIYVHCQTKVISSFAEAFPGMDRIEGNRAVLFEDESEIDAGRHGQLIHHALTYHL